ncbi:hypothetical protein JZ751_003921, partial [Albula glossodonta]
IDAPVTVASQSEPSLCLKLTNYQKGRTPTASLVIFVAIEKRPYKMLIVEKIKRSPLLYEKIEGGELSELGFRI